MKTKIIGLLLISILLFSFCYKCRVNKNIRGHWVSEKYLSDFNPGDTVLLTKRKFNDKLYQWGSGIASGYTFSEDGNFSEYNNTLCSTESDPVRYHNEHWEFKMLDTLIISGPQRIIRYKFLQPPLQIGKKLLLKLIDVRLLQQ